MAAATTPTQRRRTGGRFALNRVPTLGEVPEIARRARSAWGVSPDTRLNLDRVCDRLGVEVETVDLEVPLGGAQGFLSPRAGGFLIEVDPEPRGGWDTVTPALRPQLERHRRRFLVAHELTHTLFYSTKAEKPRRVIRGSERQETFCDELARALLVPAEAARTLPFSPQSAIEIQSRFDVSMEVALRSLAAAHGERGAAWLLFRRRAETLLQWTSAENELGTSVLRSIRQLAEQAVHEGEPTPGTIRCAGDAEALFLPDRDQVVVTWNREGISRAA